MRFGLTLPSGFDGDLSPMFPYDKVLSLAKIAQHRGFASIWLYDHLYPQNPLDESTILESWTTISALARDTASASLRLGVLVSCNAFRSPALLAKMASTVDILSGGRFTLGIGSGWYEQEFRAFGFDFPPDPVRIKQLEEAVEIILALWTSQKLVNFSGEYYKIFRGISRPTGVQLPHIPLLIGGSGEKLTLRVVARFANVANFFGSPEDVKRKLELLAQYCAEYGRNVQEITPTLNIRYCSLAINANVAENKLGQDELNRPNTSSLVGTPAMVRERIREYELAGIQEIMIRFVDLESLDIFSQEFLSC